MVEKHNTQNQYNDRSPDTIENRVNESYEKMVQDVKIW